ncbi:MAG: hypothetical protein IMZ55_05280 [Acidobacteria bacterium]|nr:hypothetical protein [Acidobacteriota bacterium]
MSDPEPPLADVVRAIVAGIYRVLSALALLLSWAVLALAVLADSAPQQAALAGIACAIAITSRIFQAESHLRRKK